MKMKKIFIFLGLAILALPFIFSVAPVKAQEDVEIEKEVPEMSKEIKDFFAAQADISNEEVDLRSVPQVNCMDYYKFQSVQVSADTDLSEYADGKIVSFKGELTNENTYPVTDGNIFVRISRDNENYSTEGRYIVDEFIAQENIGLRAGEKKAISFQWGIPRGIARGKYRADFFFSVGKKFNLGGLPFTNEVVVGGTEFTISSSQEGHLSFERNQTMVNGEPYRHIGNWPIIESGKGVTVDQKISNTLAEKKDVDVTYELYFWDSLNKKDLVDTKTGRISMEPHSSQDVQYVIPAMNDSVYYLKITATAGIHKSIINIRVTSPQKHPRLNYPAITQFPIKKGEALTLFSCMHNTSNLTAMGKVLVKLTDRNNAQIGSFEYKGAIPSHMIAQKADIVAMQNYDWAKLTADVFDNSNVLVDSYEVVYDCAQFNACTINSGGIGDAENNNNTGGFNSSKIKMMIIGIVAVVTLVMFVIIIIRHLRHKEY